MLWRTNKSLLVPFFAALRVHCRLTTSCVRSLSMTSVCLLRPDRLTGCCDGCRHYCCYCYCQLDRAATCCARTLLPEALTLLPRGRVLSGRRPVVTLRRRPHPSRSAVVNVRRQPSIQCTIEKEECSSSRGPASRWIMIQYKNGSGLCLCKPVRGCIYNPSRKCKKS